MAIFKANKKVLNFFGRDYNIKMSDNTFGKLIKSKGFNHTAHGFREEVIET